MNARCVIIPAFLATSGAQASVIFDCATDDVVFWADGKFVDMLRDDEATPTEKHFTFDPSTGVFDDLIIQLDMDVASQNANKVTAVRTQDTTGAPVLQTLEILRHNNGVFLFYNSADSPEIWTGFCKEVEQ